jgi:hypothetical protein
MTGKQSSNTQHPLLAAREDVLHLFRDLDDEDVLQILAMEATMLELQEAAAWLDGTGDILDRAGHQMTSRIAGILDIVDRGDDEENRNR